MNNRSTVILSGALTGGLLAIALLALLAGRNAMESVGLTDGGDAQLVVSSGALYLATVVAALIGGAIVSTIAYGLSATGDDNSARFELAHVLPFGLVASVATGYSLIRSGLGFAGDIEAGETSITVAALGWSALLAGITAGAVTAWVVAMLASKSVVGLEGERAPTSTAEMMKAAMQAVTGPMLAIVVIAALAIGLAQLLLAAEGVAAIAIFSVAGALVLGAAAAAAYLGGDDGATS
ncbi:MAG: hypothetical protein U9N84_13670 [Actinomycetota bacterium]|nr:hypothetical protein [Actinomycetota bacterium]